MRDSGDSGFESALQALLRGELAADSARARELYAAHPELEQRLHELRAIADSVTALSEAGPHEIAEARAGATPEDRARLRAALESARPDLARKLRGQRRWPAFALALAAAALLIIGWWSWPRSRGLEQSEELLGGSELVEARRVASGWELAFRRRLSAGARVRLRALGPQGEPLPGFEATTDQPTWQLPPRWTELVEARGSLRLSVELLDAFGEPVGSSTSLVLSSAP